MIPYLKTHKYGIMNLNFRIYEITHTEIEK